MTPPATLQIRRLDHEDLWAARERALAAFGAHQDAERLTRSLRRRLERGELVGAVEPSTGRVLAHAAVSLVDHWFGGRRVPCQHVAGVAVAPEDRGRGAATTLLRAIARTGADAGGGLSLLFPALDTLYRRLGWARAGDYAWWRLPCRAAAGVEGPPMRRLDFDDDWAAVRECHQRFGAATPAVAVREDDRWTQLAEARFGWVHDTGDGRLDAYLLVDHESKPDDWRHRLALRDWAATSPDGLRAVVSLIGRHGTTAADATVRGGFPHPFELVLAEQQLTLDDAMRWMARPLDLPAAIAARGFSPSVRVDVPVEIADDVLPERAGSWRLTVGEGCGALEPTDHPPRARLDAAAVGPLFTGYRSAEALALGGRADGDDSALAALSAAFAGPPPQLTDFF